MTEAQRSSRGVELVVKQDGSTQFSSIQAAVMAAKPGDTVTVCRGTYRETVVFPLGGETDDCRITLRAKLGDEVVITGAEPVEPVEWSTDRGGVYRLVKDNRYFDSFNPFAERWAAKSDDYPDYFSCGCVYLGDTDLRQVFTPGDVYDTPLSWYSETEESHTTVWANFGGIDPTNPASHTEINKRKQCITAAWNLGYITIDGIAITRGCGPKTVNFAQYGSRPMEGALSTNGGYRWIIENCKAYQNRGVAIDYGLGSRGHQNANGGEPQRYGHHLIRGCNASDNGTNGVMAYRGAYTEICNCVFANNNTLNTGLLSEGYVKNVNSGFGINVHDNYFYSNQAWDTFSIWFDCEDDGAQIQNNIIYSAGPEGHGFSVIYWEQSGGWCLCANNILVNNGFVNISNSNVYMVNNLFLNNTKGAFFPGLLDPFKSYGYNGYTRVLRAMKPGTLTPICTRGTDGDSHYESYVRFNKAYGNIFFGIGMTSSSRADEVADSDYDGHFYEFVNVGDAREKKDVWQATDPNYQATATKYYGNECDYNLYCAGAQKLDYQYAAARGYQADAHSLELEKDCYCRIEGDRTGCTLTLALSDSATALHPPAVSSAFLGNTALYETLGYDFFAPDVNKDFFGKKRDMVNTVPGPFAEMKGGTITYPLWPR